MNISIETLEVLLNLSENDRKELQSNIKNYKSFQENAKKFKDNLIEKLKEINTFEERKGNIAPFVLTYEDLNKRALAKENHIRDLEEQVKSLNQEKIKLEDELRNQKPISMSLGMNLEEQVKNLTDKNKERDKRISEINQEIGTLNLQISDAKNNVDPILKNFDNLVTRENFASRYLTNEFLMEQIKSYKTSLEKRPASDNLEERLAEIDNMGKVAAIEGLISEVSKSSNNIVDAQNKIKEIGKKLGLNITIDGIDDVKSISIEQLEPKVDVTSVGENKPGDVKVGFELSVDDKNKIVEETNRILEIKNSSQKILDFAKALTTNPIYASATEEEKYEINKGIDELEKALDSDNLEDIKLKSAVLEEKAQVLDTKIKNGVLKPSAETPLEDNTLNPEKQDDKEAIINRGQEVAKKANELVRKLSTDVCDFIQIEEFEDEITDLEEALETDDLEDIKQKTNEVDETTNELTEKMKNMKPKTSTETPKEEKPKDKTNPYQSYPSESVIKPHQKYKLTAERAAYMAPYVKSILVTSAISACLCGLSITAPVLGVTLGIVVQKLYQKHVKNNGEVLDYYKNSKYSQNPEKLTWTMGSCYEIAGLFKDMKNKMLNAFKERRLRRQAPSWPNENEETNVDDLDSDILDDIDHARRNR